MIGDVPPVSSIRRAIIAWRRSPRSQGILLSHLAASAAVLLIQRLLELIVVVLIKLCGIFLCCVEDILLFDAGMILAELPKLKKKRKKLRLILR